MGEHNQGKYILSWMMRIMREDAASISANVDTVV